MAGVTLFEDFSSFLYHDHPQQNPSTVPTTPPKCDPTAGTVNQGTGKNGHIGTPTYILFILFLTNVQAT